VTRRRLLELPPKDCHPPSLWFNRLRRLMQGRLRITVRGHGKHPSRMSNTPASPQTMSEGSTCPRSRRIVELIFSLGRWSLSLDQGASGSWAWRRGSLVSKSRGGPEVPLGEVRSRAMPTAL
jgi:hypothetical protein